jgi:hypothetical protein
MGSVFPSLNSFLCKISQFTTVFKFYSDLMKTGGGMRIFLFYSILFMKLLVAKSSLIPTPNIQKINLNQTYEWQKTQGASIVRPLLPFCRKTRKRRGGFLIFLAKSQFTLVCPVMRHGHHTSDQGDLFLAIRFRNFYICSLTRNSKNM